jgi:hypothetical protein
MIRQLGLDALIARQRSRERDWVVAMIAQRLLAPSSKLGTTREGHTPTLAEEWGVEDASENDLYAAMDWRLARKERIEKQLAARHLVEGGWVLYEVMSSASAGRTCPRAQWGHNRDEDKLPIIVSGVMTEGEGRPLAVEVDAGNTGRVRSSRKRSWTGFMCCAPASPPRTSRPKTRCADTSAGRKSSAPFAA